MERNIRVPDHSEARKSRAAASEPIFNFSPSQQNIQDMVDATLPALNQSTAMYGLIHSRNDARALRVGPRSIHRQPIASR